MTKSMISTKNPQILGANGKPANGGRRKFLAHTGMYGAGLLGSALLGACNSDKNVAIADDNNNSNNVFIAGPDDASILNFALNLEYLEAQYYLYGVTGNGLQDGDRGDNPGDVTVKGNPQVQFTTQLIKNYAAEIASDELHHVQLLRAALGSSAASQPAVDIQNSFAALGNLIGVSNFDPYMNEINFLIGAFIFEDVGVTAYHGGAPFIKSRAYLDAAAGILAVEAYHAGLIRTVLTVNGDMPVMNGDGSESGMTVVEVVKAISDARDSVDGSNDIDADYDNVQPPQSGDDDQGIGQTTVTIYGDSYTATNIVPVDANSVAYDRTIGQVNNVVYLNTSGNSVSKGGFYPNGTNIPTNTALQASTANGDGSDDGDSM